MPVSRFLALGAVMSLLLPCVAAAQGLVQQPTQVQIQYHELVPAGQDTTAVFLKIFDRIRKDCELVSKGFSRKCTITQINIYTNANNSGDMAMSRTVNATATMTLPPEPETPPAAK